MLDLLRLSCNVAVLGLGIFAGSRSLTLQPEPLTGACSCDCPAVVAEEDTTAPLPDGEGPRQWFGFLLRQDNWAFEISLAVLVGSPGLLMGTWRFLCWLVGRCSRRNVPVRSARRVIGREISQIGSSGSSAVPRVRC